MTGLPRASVPERIARLETETLSPGGVAALPTASRIGCYEIEGVIGRGGIGVVYRARAVDSGPVPVGQRVALKMLSERKFDDLDRRRFEREAAYLQALRHPGIVRILDLGDHEGRPFLVMQLVEGETLDEHLRRYRRQTGDQHLTTSVIAEILIQGLEALHVAHLAGILHRDLKPGNLMLAGDGAVKLLDFGMARRISAEHSRLTASGSVLGTPAYMPPEQAAGARDLFGPHTDIYSMGAVCYELATGQQPFTADTSLAVLRRILEEDLVPPSRHNPSLPRDLETVILKAMAKDPRDRYGNAEAMAYDLRQFAAGRRIRARRPGRWRPLLRRMWTNRSTVAGIGLAMFVTVVLGVLLIRQVQRHIDGRESQIQEQVEEQVRSEYDEQLQPKWGLLWEHPGALAWESMRDEARSHPLDPRLHMVELPPVSSNLALALTVQPEDDALLELMIAGRTAQDGYFLRYRATAEADRLTMLRSNASSAERRTEISSVPCPVDGPFRLALRRVDDVITATIDGETMIEFKDLAPIKGLENDRIAIALSPESVTVANIVLERQRPPEKVSRLVAFDMIRQEGRYERALAMYREFLRDFPDSEDSRSARYRIGLCLEQLGRYREALDTFADLASASEDDPRYFINATFHAWSTALKLGRYNEADRYFNAIRRRFDIRQLLAAVPMDTLATLPMDYIQRARRTDDTAHARTLYLNAIDIATFLEEHRLIPMGLFGLGDLSLAEGEIAEAVNHFRRIAENATYDRRDRHEALRRIGNAQRLRFRFSESRSAYQRVIDQGHGGDAQRARLWLGDLLLYLGDREAALGVWRSSTDAVTRPGRVMAHLVAAADDDEHRALPIGDDPFFANDLEYFNAVSALLKGDERLYRERLGNVLAMEAEDWPTGLARRILEEDE